MGVGASTKMLPGRTTLYNGLVCVQSRATVQRGSDLQQDEDTRASVSVVSDRQCSDTHKHQRSPLSLEEAQMKD